MNVTKVEELPPKIEEDSILSIQENNVSHLTHGIHKYPGKFIPQLPAWALNKYSEKVNSSYVLDPFCGSGTTLLECSVRNFKSIGIDIDPLSCLITKVKTTPIPDDRLNYLEEVFSNFHELTETNHIPKIDNLSHWFSDEAVTKLSKLRTHIESLYEERKINKDEYDFLIIIFSSIIRKVSNADNRSQKTYVSHTRFKEPADVFEQFEKNFKKGVEDLRELGDIVNSNYILPKIYNENVEYLDTLGKNYDIGLMITSPPYIKSIDYIYNQMAELFWVGDLFQLETQPKQNEKKRKYLGAKNILKKEYSTLDIENDKLDIEELDQNIEQIYFNDQKNGEKHAYIVYDFFKEMELHLETAFNALQDNGSYVMIVGNSSVSGLKINTAKFISKLAQRAGFTVRNSWAYEIRNRYMGFDRKGKGGLIDCDHVLEFSK